MDPNGEPIRTLIVWKHVGLIVKFAVVWCKAAFQMFDGFGDNGEWYAS